MASESGVSRARPFVISVTVAGKRWRRVRDLATAGPEADVYRLVTEPDGTMRVEFGDGVRGRCPAAGAAVRATYRCGGGIAGNMLWRVPTKAEPTRELCITVGPAGLVLRCVDCTSDQEAGGSDPGSAA